jgi:hypothetical protein
VVVFSLAFGLAFPARAQDGKAWSFEAALDYSSVYLYRGVNLLGGGQGVFSAHAGIERGIVSLLYDGYRGRFDKDGASGRYDEHDVLIQATVKLGDDVYLSLGVTGLDYGPAVTEGLGFRDTWELGGTFTWDVFLHPTIAYSQDVAALDGGYGTIGLEHTIGLGPKAGIDLAASLGIDNGYNGPRKGQVNDILLRATGWADLGPHVSARLEVRYSIAGPALGSLEQGDETILGAGLTASF